MQGEEKGGAGDLDMGNSYRNSTFNFARHREPQCYGMIVEGKGAVVA